MHCLVWPRNTGLAHSPALKFFVPGFTSVQILVLYFALLFMFSYSTSRPKPCEVQLQPITVVILSKLSAGNSQSTNTKFMNVPYTQRAAPSCLWVALSEPRERIPVLCEVLAVGGEFLSSSFLSWSNFP